MQNFFHNVINNYRGNVLLSNLRPPSIMIPKDIGIQSIDVIHNQLQAENGKTFVSFNRIIMI